MTAIEQFVLGIDLSGPSNLADTAVVVFVDNGSELRLHTAMAGVGDAQIFSVAANLLARAPLAVGIDAPLSYNPGGGDRPGDAALRARLRAAGLPYASVMTPTMTRMAYLTLRGVAVARGLTDVGRARARVAEVHPAAALLLRSAPVDAVTTLKRNQASCTLLLEWLDEQGIKGVRDEEMPTDHFVAACAAALAAKEWQIGRPAWIEPAKPPVHPFDFVA